MRTGNNTESGRERPAVGFSLLELVIVIVIVAITAAIAIPRMSRGTAGAADAALTGDLAVLRNAIDQFVAEHEGTIPAAGDIENALLKYSDKAGTDFADAQDPAHIYGPYIRAIPPLPLGMNKGDTGIATSDGVGVGWIYDPDKGSIRANCPGVEWDASGTKYMDY